MYVYRWVVDVGGRGVEDVYVCMWVEDVPVYICGCEGSGGYVGWAGGGCVMYVGGGCVYGWEGGGGCVCMWVEDYVGGWGWRM